MKVIFFECNMGAAGDMLMSAMLDLLDEPEKFIQELNMLNIPGVHFDLMQFKKMRFTGSTAIMNTAMSTTMPDCLT